MIYHDENGTPWEINVEGITMVLRMWAQAKAQARSVSLIDDDGVQDVFFDQRQFVRLREDYFLPEYEHFQYGFQSQSPLEYSLHLVRRLQQTERFSRVLPRTLERFRQNNSREVDRRVRFGENTISALRFIRDTSALIFMTCIPISSLGLGAAMTARLGGSVFQGIGTYQDTGNVVGAIATTVLNFKSSLMALPSTASRGASLLFSVVNNGNAALANSAIRMASVDRSNTTTFTDVLREEIIGAGLGQLTGRILNPFQNRMSRTTIPIVQVIDSRMRGRAAQGISALFRTNEDGSRNRSSRGNSSSQPDQTSMNRRPQFDIIIPQHQDTNDTLNWDQTPTLDMISPQQRRLLWSNEMRHVEQHLIIPLQSF